MPDAGCGSGRYAQQFAAREARVTAVDESPAMLEHAWRRSEARSGEARGVELRAAALREPLPTGAFRQVKPQAYERMLRQPAFLLVRPRPWPGA